LYIPKEGAKATAASGTISATAKYGGSRGNDLRFSVIESPTGGFDVTIYLDADPVAAAQGVQTIEELAATENDWMTFSGSGTLAEIPGIKLDNGTDGVASNSDLTAFLDASERQIWNTLAFPLAPTGQSGDTTPALLGAVGSKIEYLRNQTGKYRKAVVTELAADFA